MNQNQAPALRLFFMGSSSFSIPTLKKLSHSQHDIVTVVAPAPKRQKRGQHYHRNIVHRIAAADSLSIITPTTLDQAFCDHIIASQIDALIVVAYGLLLPKTVLSATRHGCINLHPSLLPEWRGAAPIQRALMAGDTKTGVSIIRLSEKLDSGAILKQQDYAISDTINAEQLAAQLAEQGAQLMLDVLNALAKGQTLTARPQPSHAKLRYAKKITLAETKINWQNHAQNIHNQIRALAPKPAAWCWWNNKRLKILQTRVIDATRSHTAPVGSFLNQNGHVACQTGTLAIQQLQCEGRKAMPIEQFLCGARLDANSTLT